MTRTCLGAALLLVTGCQFTSNKKQFEEWNMSVPGSRFKTIATVAATNSPADIRLTGQLREQLKADGWHAVPRSGRWGSVSEAVTQICAPGEEQPVDGVLLVTYDHLVLYDCQSLTSAFEIQSSPEGGGMGLPDLTQHLIDYLSGKPRKG